MGMKGLVCWLRSGEVSEGFYKELVRFVEISLNTRKVDSYKFGLSKQELAQEIVHSFFLKMPRLREMVLERSETPEGYFVRSLNNFVSDYLSFKGTDEVCSLDEEVNDGEVFADRVSGSELVDLTVLEKEELEYAYTKFLERISQASKSIERNLLVFLVTELEVEVNEDSFVESLSQSNVYKIRQRIKEFLRDFANEYGFDSRTVAKVVLKYATNLGISSYLSKVA